MENLEKKMINKIHLFEVHKIVDQVGSDRQRLGLHMKSWIFKITWDWILALTWDIRKGKANFFDWSESFDAFLANQIPSIAMMQVLH